MMMIWSRLLVLTTCFFPSLIIDFAGAMIHWKKGSTVCALWVYPSTIAITSLNVYEVLIDWSTVAHKECRKFSLKKTQIMGEVAI